ncbi:MAG: SUMF1/EgtB/PvdO family nonheme iron enzyme [Planctomycetes bacterium]|nr:SUMF1/EgtB/PvdO family nonheme iron enzyme [Planctomycetota bacterium]
MIDRVVARLGSRAVERPRVEPVEPCEAVLHVASSVGGAIELELRWKPQGEPVQSERATLRLAISPEGVTAGELSIALREQARTSGLYRALFDHLAADSQHPAWTRFGILTAPGCVAAGLPWEGLALWHPDGHDAVLRPDELARPFVDRRIECFRLADVDVPARDDTVRQLDGALRVLVVVGHYVQRQLPGEPAQQRVTAAVTDEILAQVGELVSALREPTARVQGAPPPEIVVLAPRGAGSFGELHPVEVAGLGEVRAWLRGDASDPRARAGFDALIWIGKSDATEQSTGRHLQVHVPTDVGFDWESYGLDDLAADLRARPTRTLILHGCRLDPEGGRALCTAVEHVIGWSSLVPPARCRAFDRAFFAALRDDPSASVGRAVAVVRSTARCDDLLHFARGFDTRGFVIPEQAAFDAFRVRMRDALRPLPFDVLAHRQAPIDLYVRLDAVRHRSESDVEFARRVEARELVDRRDLGEWLDDRRWRGVALLGDPGAGKSTLLRQIALERLGRGDLAVFAPIKLLVDRAVGALDRLRELGNDYAALAPEMVQRFAAAGRLVLLLDALDEVADPNRAWELIDSLRAANRQGRLVVAMRIVGATPVAEQFVTLRVDPLAEERQRELLGNWFRALQRSALHPALWSWLQQFPTGDAGVREAVGKAWDLIGSPRGNALRRECENPLMLTLTALRIAKAGPDDLAHTNRRSILVDAVKSLARGEYRREGVFDSRELGAVLRVLRALARELFEQQLTQAAVRDDLGEPTAFGRALATRLRGNRLPSGHPALDSEQWAWRLPLDAALFASRLARTGLVGFVTGARDLEAELCFPLQSFADVLAAESIAEEFGLAGDGAADLDGLLAWLAGVVKAARSHDDARAAHAQTAPRMARVAETLSLVASWLAGDDATTRWLVALHELDPQLGLRALALTPRPPADAIRKLLGGADPDDKQRFWDGFAAAFELERPADASSALEVLEQLATHLRSGIDRFFIEEEAIAIVARHPGRPRLREVAGRVQASARGGLDVQPLPGAERFRSIVDPAVWRRIAPEVIGYESDTYGFGDDLREVPVPGEFWLMAVPVTVGMYRGFDLDHEVRWRRKTIAIREAQSDAADDQSHGLDCPVNWVTWWDAVAFARSVAALPADQLASALGIPLREFESRRAAGWRFRLPGEWEWEWACRAGSGTRFWCGDWLTKEHGWHEESRSGSGVHPVGRLRANDFGLFDMHGNCWEWQCDAWEDTAAVLAHAPDHRMVRGERGSVRVLRGGSFWDDAACCRSAFRFRNLPGDRNFVDYVYLGLRVCFGPPLPSSGAGIEDR